VRSERDAARRESAKAHTERDSARRESATARGERDAAIRDRDRARQERQVLLSRVRSEGEKRRGVQPASAARETTPSIPAPPIVSAAPAPDPSERFEADSGLAARIGAVAALILLVAVVVLLVSSL